MTGADIQGWMTSAGVFLTGCMALAAFIQSLRNGWALKREAATSLAARGDISKRVDEVITATNGMKKELETKAFEAGIRSTEGHAASVLQASATAATAAKVVADAARVAADLVAATAAAKK